MDIIELKKCAGISSTTLIRGMQPIINKSGTVESLKSFVANPIEKKIVANPLPGRLSSTYRHPSIFSNRYSIKKPIIAG